jgi:two-component system, chemotaxis family, CheB/CheR fusion protein
VTDPATAERRFLQLTCYGRAVSGSTEDVAEALILVTDATASVSQRQAQSQVISRNQAEIKRLERLAAQLAESNRQLLDANQELGTINAELRGANEEYLLGSEEAQSSMEEVETLNEELQATNEELETLNEELQATVEEVNTTNEDLQARAVEMRELAESREKERHTAERERSRLSAVIASMADAVLVVDVRGREVLTNSAFAMFMKSSHLRIEDHEGRPVPEDNTPTVRAARGESFTMDFRMRDGDGKQRWFEAIGRPVQPESGSRHESVFIIRDTTERSLRRLQDEFLSIASHELRTPLTVLHGYLQVLRRTLQPRADDEALTRYVELSLGQSRRLQLLVKDLLDVGRLQTGKLRLDFDLVDVAQLVRNMCETGLLLAPDHPIHVDADDQPLYVKGDAPRLEEAIQNLLTNAATYSPEGAQIDVWLSTVKGDVEIRVIDQGKGIPTEDLPLVFSKFFTVSGPDRATSKGLGLGLFIAQELISAHGGSISAESNPGQGATLTIRLPLAKESRPDDAVG